MLDRGARFVRAAAAVCLTLGVSAALPRDAGADGVDRVLAAPGVEHAERKPVVIVPADTHRSPVLVYPAATESEARPLVLFLHGMCDSPENECPSLAGATGDRFLACPRANLRCDGGGTIWSGDPKTRVSVVDDALTRVETAFPERVARSGRTLVGFSLGSFVAVDVAERQKGVWKNLILLGAKIEPDAQRLKDAGVESVLLGAGDRDMMKWHMVSVAKRLEKQGIRARFVGMGDVGHWFAEDMDAWLAKAFQWLEEKDHA